MDNIELIKKLKKIDEVSLLELLEITSEDLVDVFVDKIEERIDYIVRALED